MLIYIYKNLLDYNYENDKSEIIKKYNLYHINFTYYDYLVYILINKKYITNENKLFLICDDIKFNLLWGTSSYVFIDITLDTYIINIQDRRKFIYGSYNISFIEKNIEKFYYNIILR